LTILVLFGPAQCKSVGNDIIVNIGQTNDDNHNHGYKGSKDKPVLSPSNDHNQPPNPPSNSTPDQQPPSLDQQPPAPPAKPAAKETMCSAKGQTIQVEPNAVQGHLKAGAKLGPCPKQTKAPTSEPSSAPTPSPEPTNSTTPSPSSQTTAPTSPSSPSTSPPTSPP
ncbi:hypothetical protein BVRB_022550, partial [Beta vulgaris subsp. vulgaris]